MDEQKTVNWKGWDAIDAPKESRYWQPELGKSYRIRFLKVDEPKPRAFKEGDKEKLRVLCHLRAINGEPSDLIWETGSYSVMRELKKHVLAGSILRTEFLIKKEKKGDKTSYIFEPLGLEETL